MSHPEKMLNSFEENKIESQLSIFWNIIQDSLPKCIERSALGDEKIFLAVKKAYTEFVPYIVNRKHLEYLQESKKRLEGSYLTFDSDIRPSCDNESCSALGAYNSAITSELEIIRKEIKKTEKMI